MERSRQATTTLIICLYCSGGDVQVRYRYSNDILVCFRFGEFQEGSLNFVFFMYFSDEERYRRAGATLLTFLYFSGVERAKRAEATLRIFLYYQVWRGSGGQPQH